MYMCLLSCIQSPLTPQIPAHHNDVPYVMSSVTVIIVNTTTSDGEKGGTVNHLKIVIIIIRRRVVAISPSYLLCVGSRCTDTQVVTIFIAYIFVQTSPSS